MLIFREMLSYLEKILVFRENVGMHITDSVYSEKNVNLNFKFFKIVELL